MPTAPRIAWHPDRDSDAPEKRKRPAVFVLEPDLFATALPMRTLRRLWDLMWACSRHTFLVRTRHPERLVRFFKRRACARDFGWTDLDREPMKPGDHPHLDTLYYRNRCGWVGHGSYACRHPEGGKGRENTCCIDIECPIAHRVYDRETLRKIGVADQYEYDDEGYTDDSPDWMELHTRPKDAMAANVWLGFAASNQEEFEAGARAFRPLRWNNPFVKLFADLSPIEGRIDFRIPYYATGDEHNRSLWSPLERHLFADGGHESGVPFLKMVQVSGGEKPVHPNWIDNILCDCHVDGGGVDFRFDGWGDWVPCTEIPRDDPRQKTAGVYMDFEGRTYAEDGPVPLSCYRVVRVGARRSGRLLRGRTWDGPLCDADFQDEHERQVTA